MHVVDLLMTLPLMSMRREAGSVILKIAYGYTPEAHRRDPLVDLAQHCMHIFADATTPGKWIVDVIPFCETPSSVLLQCLLMTASALPTGLGSRSRIQNYSTPVCSSS
jgi:hypothetical protein